jgi:hypothetical protein
MLHDLGFRLRRLRHRHPKAQPEEQAAFRAELEERLAAWPEEWELICVDEATVRRHPTLTAQWCLVDEVPEVPTGDDHTKVHGYGAITPLTGRTHCSTCRPVILGNGCWSSTTEGRSTQGWRSRPSGMSSGTSPAAKIRCAGYAASKPQIL